jgi:hypothetical protein
MISVKSRRGDSMCYLNTQLIECIIEREGNTSEIVLTSGHIYTSIESPKTISERILASLEQFHEKPNFEK